MSQNDGARFLFAACAERYIKNRISGSPRQCLARLKQYAEVGLSHLILVFLDPGDVDIFVKQVLPEFRESNG